MSHDEWEGIEFSIATTEDSALPAFDFTKLSAINTCPTWGILRYTHHRAMPGGGRAMALEAGKVMHDCFAVVRLVSLGHPLGQDKPDHAVHHGDRLFGRDRWDAIRSTMNADDLSISLRNAALECLRTSEFVEDPYDKRRTEVNLETSLLYYVQRWDAHRYPVWIESDDPSGWIGVEIPFAIKCRPKVSCAGHYADAVAGSLDFLYTGRVDGIHVDRNGELIIQENKTASRLNDAWRMSFAMSHQVTGYCIAASLFAKQTISRGLVLGLSLPLPRTMSDGMAIEMVSRPDYMKHSWIKWLEHTVRLNNAYKDRILEAPQYTHSCNRYFRPCSFIPFCAGDADERKLILTEMVTEEWSPLHEKTGD